MPTMLRPVTDADRDAVLDLNHANVVKLAPMDTAKLDLLREISDRFDVVDVDGLFGGFVITFGPGTDYDSDNYRWFSERHPDGFYYLDRIVLHPDLRRQGLGSFVYDEIERTAAVYGRLTLEVNVVPRNGPSLSFHEGRGFVEVGRLGDEEHTVALMEKDL